MRRFFKTLYGKLVLVLVMLLLFSLTVIWLHRETVRRYNEEQQIASARQETAIYASTINTSFTLLEENLFYLPYNNPDVQTLTEYETPEARDSMNYWAAVSALRRQFSTLQKSCPYVESFFAWYPAQELFLNEQVNPEMSLYIRALTSGESAAIPERWTRVTLPDGVYLLRIYPMHGYYLGVWLSCDELLDSFTGGTSTFFLTDPDGERLSSGAPGALDAAALGKVSPQREGLLLSSFAEHPGLYLVRELTRSELRASGSFSRLSFALVCLLHVLLLSFVLISVTVWVLHPLRTLLEGIRTIRGGETNYRMPPAPRLSTEFQEIRQEFNAMMDETQQIRIQMYEQQLQQDEIRLRYLSQQIQPHFILNSLNTLYAYTGRDTEIARKIIRLLIQYYRYIINIESQYVRVGEELAHIENYLAFQKLRYADRLDYEIRCDTAAADVPIPPLMLESFVGNALKYGQDETDHLHIEVCVEKSETSAVRIRIRDQGKGFPGEMLDALRSYQKEGKKDDLLGIGICNSLDRLHLIYGADADVFFYNEETGGAVVEIVIRPGAEEKESAP